MSRRLAGAAMTVILDTQAIHLLARPEANPAAAKRVLDRLAVAARRKRAGADVRVVVPTAVRVEGLWNRQRAEAATVNRHRIDDVPLDTGAANVAAGIRADLGTGISIADAHIGATLAATKDRGPHTVLTSDRPDVRRIANRVGVPISVMKV